MAPDDLRGDRVDDLERLMSARLRQLPAPHAPASLRRRVMTAVSTDRPAVRPWSIWPRVWQSIFALGLMVIAGSAALAWSVIAADARGDAWWQIGLQAVAGTTGTVGALRDGLGLAFSWFTAALMAPPVLAIVAVVAGAAIAFIVLGAWLSRIALPSLAWSKGASR